MQVTQTLSEGLKREYKVVVTATDLGSKLSSRLEELKDKVRINGFRPGKVPVEHLRRTYGKSVMAEVIEQAVNEANNQITTDNGFKLAGQPKITFPEDKDEIEGVMDGARDLAYSVVMELLPAIEIGDLKSLSIEKPVAEVSEKEVADALQRIADGNRAFAPRAEGEAAANGDKVTVSFVGTIDGVAFEGGSADDIAVELGSNSFIPGFEEQLVGIKAGESRTLDVTFPTNYGAEQLAGKAASFAVTAKTVEAPQARAIDDELAKMVGMESLEKLTEAVKEQIGREHGALTRRKAKRALLDALDGAYKFDVPESLLNEEFEGVWQSITQDLAQQNRTFADEGTTEEAARDDYRKIAERRVRLGLLLAEIGEKKEIKVTDDEVSRAVVERARQFPGQEQQVWEFYRKNPQALASLRAPIFEEKVVDWMLAEVTVTEKPVSVEDLVKEDDVEA